MDKILDRINSIEFKHGDSNDLYALLAAGWVHVTEQMPKNVTPVLVLGWCCDICHNIKIAEMEDDWFESGTGEDLHFKPDFWQPLPYPACS
jgi:hypothetical protein